MKILNVNLSKSSIFLIKINECYFVLKSIVIIIKYTCDHLYKKNILPFFYPTGKINYTWRVHSIEVIMIILYFFLYVIIFNLDTK